MEFEDRTTPNQTSNGIPFDGLEKNEILAILDKLPSGVSIFDGITGHIVFANQRAASTVGLTLDELLHRTWMDMTQPEDIPNQQRKIEELLNHLVDSARIEKKLRHSDEKTIWVQLNITRADLVQWPNHILSLIYDVTEQKLLEQELQASMERFKLSEQKFTAAFNCSPDAVNINRLRDGMYLDINNGFTQLMGYTEKEVFGKTSLELNIWNNQADRRKLVTLLQTDGQVHNLEAVFRRKDGALVTALMSAALIEIDSEKCIVSITRDINERKAAEVALRESEVKLKRAVDEVPFPIMLYAEDGEIIDINRAWEEITGYGSSQLGNYADWSERAYGIRQNVDQKELKHLYKSKVRQSHGERTIQSADGKHHIWEMFSVSIGKHATDGRQLIMTGGVDITARKWQEQALQEKEIKYRSLFEDAPDGIAIFNPDGKIIDANPKMAEMEGYDIDELRKMSIQDFDKKGSSREIKKRIDMTLKGKAWTKRTVHIRKDGSELPLEISSSRVLYDHAPAMLSFCRDLSEQQKLEHDRADLENQYRMLFENLTEGFALHEMIYDASGQAIDYRFLAVNSFFEDIIGLKAADIIGKTVRELLPATEQYWIDAYAEVATTGHPIAFHNYSMELGRYFRIGAFCPIPGQFAVIINDMTDEVKKQKEIRKINEKLEEKVQQRTEELAQAYQIKSDFIMSMGHELRSPLTSILGYSELMARGIGGALTEQQRIQIERTRQSGEYLLHIINDMLDMARIDNGQQLPTYENFSLATLHENIEAVVHPLLEKKAVSYSMEIAAGTDRFYSDPIQIQQIMINLISNAVKFTPVGGSIKIKIDQDSPQWLSISVADDGCGIPAAEIDKVFIEFYQTDAGKQDRTGSGLGLAISKRLAEGLGGILTVESWEGKGSTFTLQLPIFSTSEEISYHRRQSDVNPPKKLSPDYRHIHRRNGD